MGSKTDLEQLLGILENFSSEVIQEAISSLPDGSCKMYYKDFGDPGQELKIGEDGHVPVEDLSHLERIIADNNLLPVHFLEEGNVVQKAVARVTLTQPHNGLGAGSGWGTGFLVSPSLFMTNNHVIPTTAFANKVEMQFNFQMDYKGNPQVVDTYSTDPADVFHTNVGLDYTLVRLDPHCTNQFTLSGTNREAGEEYGNVSQVDELASLSALEPRLPWYYSYPWARLTARPIFRNCTNAGQKWGHIRLRRSIGYTLGEHLNIVQHPSGRRKEVALQKNTVTTIYTNRVRYTTDTEPGSSGSPVFDNGWDLISIHHAGGDRQNGVWLNNEGMRIDKIVADLRNHYGGTTSGNQILAELGIN